MYCKIFKLIDLQFQENKSFHLQVHLKICFESAKVSICFLINLLTNCNVFWMLLLSSYSEMMRVSTSLSQFMTPLGPIVDGHVIPDQPYKVMQHFTEHFSQWVFWRSFELYLPELKLFFSSNFLKRHYFLQIIEGLGNYLKTIVLCTYF